MSWINRILLALFAVAAVAFLPRYEGVMRADDLARVQAEREQLAEDNSALRVDIERLQAEVDGLKRDPEDPASASRADRETARIAREDLNLVKAGEFVFELERPVPAAKAKGSIAE